MSLQCSMIWYKSRGLDQFTYAVPFGKFTLQVRDGKQKKKTVKLSYLSSIISSGQFTFLPTFYDPMSFIIFLLSARSLTHGKTKLPRGLKTNPSCRPASINHLWYTVHVFFWALPPIFTAWSIEWLNQTALKQFENTNVLRQWFRIKPRPAFLDILLSIPAFPTLSTVTLHRWGGCVCEIDNILPDQALPTSKYCILAVTSTRLSQCNCFSSSVIFY